MSTPILIVHDAGVGVTPHCPDARFNIGDVVRVRRLKHLRHLPDEGAVACVVPPGFPAEYALADASGRRRPLMITKPSRLITYIVAFEDDPTPHLLREAYLLPSGKAPVSVGFEGEEHA